MLLPGLLLLFFYLLICPAAALQSTRDGLLLWYHSVLPVLFPFMLLSGLLLKFNFLKHLPAFFAVPFQKLFGISQNGAFAVLTGFFCGFPMGAKITCDLHAEKKISAAEARFLYGFVNNLSPAFLISYLAADQLACPQYRGLFLFTILGAAALYGLLTSVSFRRGKAAAENRTDAGTDYATAGRHGAAEADASTDSAATGSRRAAEAHAAQRSVSDTFACIDGCIYSSVRSTVKLGVYITIFKIISDAFLSFAPLGNPLALLLGASIEVTGGIHLLADAPLSFHMKLILIDALCAFGGFSALAQTVSIAAFDKNALFYYIKSRVMITLLSIALTIISVLFLSLVRL